MPFAVIVVVVITVYNDSMCHIATHTRNAISLLCSALDAAHATWSDRQTVHNLVWLSFSFSVFVGLMMNEGGTNVGSWINILCSKYFVKYIFFCNSSKKTDSIYSIQYRF